MHIRPDTTDKTIAISPTTCASIENIPTVTTGAGTTSVPGVG
jgi:hypothetical protein